MESEKVSYLGLPNCIRLSNGDAEVVVTTDVGPRIVRYAAAGGENLLGEFPDAAKPTALGEWKPWGGHRLWAAPESVPRTYHPDNDPVDHAVEGGSVRLTQPLELATGLRKEMAVELAPSGFGVVVRHRITNGGMWPVELAVWALTVVREGGVVVLPQEPYAPHGDETLLPARSMVLWSYSDLGDPRFAFGRKYLRVRSDPGADAAVKVGVSNRRGWAAYAVAGSLFVKRYAYEEGAVYPDLGCNTEVFTAGGYTELETLGPLRRVEPGGAAEHVERWSLFTGVDVGGTDDSVDRALLPLSVLSSPLPRDQSTSGASACSRFCRSSSARRSAT